MNMYIFVATVPITLCVPYNITDNLRFWQRS